MVELYHEMVVFLEDLKGQAWAEIVAMGASVVLVVNSVFAKWFAQVVIWRIVEES